MKTDVLFWDASALVPLAIEEAASAIACQIWIQSAEAHAWEWVSVEVDAALARRKASPGIWHNWHRIQQALCLYALRSEDIIQLRLLNRGICLRAADAGHLFLYHKIAQRIDMQLVTFDREMIVAAQNLGLRIHPDCL